MDNPYAAPQSMRGADRTPVALPAEGDFPEIDTPALERIFRHSRTIATLAQFSVVLCALAILLLTLVVRDRRQTPLFYVVDGVVIAALALNAVGLFARQAWGRFVGMLGYALTGIGLAAMFGAAAWDVAATRSFFEPVRFFIMLALVLVVLVFTYYCVTMLYVRRDLFGDDRLDHRRMQAELRRRRETQRAEMLRAAFGEIDAEEVVENYE
ncbi:MAG: hypothetical protein QM811_24805 [Pirellulales bacterium]